MKFKRVVIVVVIVSVIHAGMWFFLLRSSGAGKPSETDVPQTQGTQQAVQTGAQAAPAGQQSGQAQPQAAPAGQQAVQAQPQTAQAAQQSGVSSVSGLAPLPSPSSYSPMVNDPGDLPVKLEKSIKDECRSGILVDLSSRRILWQKNAATTYAIASMSKIMTAYELICELHEPGCKVTLETKVQVPRKMYRKFSDCHVYMDPREQFTVDELLKCMMIHSANDCAYLLAEFMAGSEEAYVQRMNNRAKAMGLTSLNFVNSNGLPDRARKQANRGSAFDMARLAEVVADIPEIMKWAGTQRDAIRENVPNRRFDLTNKNHLLGNSFCPGITGLKTGYIDESKFCITLTCERNGRRMVCVVMGVDKAKRRDRIAMELLNWGYSVK